MPTLLPGARRRPTRPGADLTVPGVARLVAEFPEEPDLRDVTLVMGDWGGAQALVPEDRPQWLNEALGTFAPPA